MTQSYPFIHCFFVDENFMAIGHTTFLLHLLQPSLDTWTYFLNAIPALYFNIYLAYVSATAK